jgi:hypothetical protein
MDAFLSYGHRDTRIAHELRDELALLGVTVWEYHREIRPGVDWRQALEDAIRAAPVLLVLVGKGAEPGPHQVAEWRLMLEAAWQDTGKRLIPVLLPGAMLPKFVSSGNRDLKAVQIHDPRDLAEAAQVIARTIRGEETSVRTRRGDSTASVFSVHADLEGLRQRVAENKQLARDLGH